MKTEHRIAFKAGITRSPSDFLCEDGELAECINLTTDHEELKIITDPLLKFDGARKNAIIYVHETSFFKNYICLKPSGSGYTIGWFDDLGNSGDVTTENYGSDAESTISITHVGNILVISSGTLLRYVRCEVGGTGRSSYTDLGNKIPEPEVEFMVVGYNDWANRVPYVVQSSGQHGECVKTGERGDNVVSIDINDGKQEEYNNLVVGLYSKCLDMVKERKRFSRPFFVRYALELYDGSYIYVSAPVMLFPCISHNCMTAFDENKLTMTVWCCSLYQKCKFDYSEWKDLVKGVVVFCSAEVNIYETGGDQTPVYSSGSQRFRDGVYALSSGVVDNGSDFRFFDKAGTAERDPSYYFCSLNLREENDIVSDLQSSSVFYKLYEAGIVGTDNWENCERFIGSHVVETLTTQSQLVNDDYYSHCPIGAKILRSYNSRLILSGVVRGFFKGYTQFSPYHGVNENDTDIYVYIKTASGIKVVHRKVSTYERMGLYFYYPDARAYRAVIFVSDVRQCTLELKEHPFLNGAYYFEELPTSGFYHTGGYEISMSECDEAVDSTVAENLYGELLQSEVDNPFVFLPRGHKRVCGGRIITTAILSAAVSEGQFGRHPIVVFTNEGIWTMEVDVEGYLEPAQPMSREVCLGSRCVVETDDAVYFASKRGLMLLSGGSVRSVSDHMRGAYCNVLGIATSCNETDGWDSLLSDSSDSCSFLAYISLPDLFLAYDYIDRRILMTSPSKGFSYVYNMSDGTISKVVFSDAPVRSVSDYPDSLLQGSTGIVRSLYDKPDESEAGNGNRAFLLTRPLKLTGPVGVGSIKELLSVGVWDESQGSIVKTRLFMSDNLIDWYEAGSRFGAAAKYYRIGLYLRLHSADRLSGTIVRYQERRGSNMRSE